jgi:2-dehydropantoate 2-reductase
MSGRQVIAVVGVGAVGGALAARLVARGRDEIVLCVCTPFDELVVESAAGVLRARPRVVVRPEEVGPVAWILLAVKAHQTEGAAPWLRTSAGSQTTVAVLQNGVEHVERTAPFVDGATILPVVVKLPATAREPGRIVQRAQARLTVPANDAGRRFAALFEGTDVAVKTVEDFRTEAWKKLCLNVAGSAITALTGRPMGVLRRPEVSRLARGLVEECVKVGRAEGAALDDACVDEVLASMIDGPPDAITSALTDRRAGRLLEHDAKNGAVVRIGARHGIDAPLNRASTTPKTARWSASARATASTLP